MPEYVQGFVLPVPKKNLKAYQKMADQACEAWIRYGALDYRECVMVDAKNDMGPDFPKLVKVKKDETVVFAWITYKSKADMNRIMKKVMADAEMECDENHMPFDMKRMTYGGFEPIVSSQDIKKKPAKKKLVAKKKAAVKTATPKKKTVAKKPVVKKTSAKKKIVRR